MGMGHTLGLGSLQENEVCMVEVTEVKEKNSKEDLTFIFPNNYWTLHFDGAKWYLGTEVGVILTSPEERFYILASN